MQTSALAQKLANSDDFAFVSKRKFKRIINFRISESAHHRTGQVYKDNGESCISEKGISKRIYNDLRIKALNFAKKGEYGRVIDLYARIINDKKQQR
jgi:hypothetical protein